MCYDMMGLLWRFESEFDNTVKQLEFGRKV